MPENLGGIYRGVCKNTADPENRNRIQVSIPSVFGDAVVPYWVWPCLPPGWRHGVTKPHDTHVGHSDHPVPSHGHTVASTGTGTGTGTGHATGLDSRGDTHNLDVATIVSTTVTTTGTTSSVDASAQTHDHNHDAHTNNILPSGSDPGGHVLHQTTPAVGEGVWIMFEAGDSSKPVWMGTI